MGLNAIKKTRGRNKNLNALFPYFSFLLIFGFFTVTGSGRFLTYNNFKTIIQQTAVLSIVSMGVHFVIVTGAIDLSVGSVLAFTGMVGANMAQLYGFPGLLIGIPIGGAIGLITGLTYTYLRIPAFITTLGMQMAVRGLTVQYSQSNPVPLPRDVLFIGKYPNILFIMLGVFIVMFIIYNFTTFGRHSVAIGGNEHIAVLNGIPAKRIKILVFMVAGLLAGLGGITMAGRLGAATPTVGTSFEVSCIAAVALGGTSLAGGVGSIQNTMIGALITSMLSNGLTILGATSETQQIITGVILILACFISLDRKKVGIVK